MEFSNVIGVIVLIGFAAFIYHKVKSKKDGKGFVERYSGGKIGGSSQPKKSHK